MIILNYLLNLSLFSLLVSTPLVIRSFFNHKSPKYFRIWAGIYGGIVAIILVSLTFQHDGYSYDIRYAPIILAFTYLGPVAGLITGTLALVARLYTSGNWIPAILGWSIIMLGFTFIQIYTVRLTALKRLVIMFVSYIIIYITMVPIIFNVFRNSPFFHIEYLFFVMLGTIFGALIIESYEKLYRMNKKVSYMNQKLIHTQKTLEESESKYRLIAENTSDLIMVMNKDHSVSYYSPSHQQVLGYSMLELEKSELCKFIHPEDIQLFKDKLKSLFENKESELMEFRMKHLDGNCISVESHCMPVLGESNQIEYVVIISRDISERKKAEEFLLQSEKLSIVGELAAGVAHEIRNPLTTIKGFVQLFKEDKSYVYTDLIISELVRIETITSELLSLGKPQAVQLVRVNVLHLLENTVELLSPQALMNDIELQLSHEGSPLYITCEKNQMKQVFLNLLKNAMESMNSGGKINIHVRKHLSEGCIISFQDEGCGIPNELLPRLGEPFYSLKEKGTGLGLMICHKIIKQHNGTITYQSEVNCGTLVEVNLPIAN